MRIITGVAKGRRLAAPATEQTRPATDRVREAIFSAIGPWVEDASVLDLYAGSGSYGLEALSRGAKETLFVENGRLAIDSLRRNIATVGLGGRLVSAEVEEYLSRPGSTRFHLVFIDPPWDLATEVVDRQLVAVDRVLEPEGEVIVSRREGDDAPSAPASWWVATDRRYGDARIYRYAKSSTEEGQ